jgi:hypothetical protein
MRPKRVTSALRQAPLEPYGPFGRLGAIKPTTAATARFLRDQRFGGFPICWSCCCCPAVFVCGSDFAGFCIGSCGSGDRFRFRFFGLENDLTFGFFGFFTSSASAFVTLLVVAQAARVSGAPALARRDQFSSSRSRATHQKLPVRGLRDKPLGSLRAPWIAWATDGARLGPAIGAPSAPNGLGVPVGPMEPEGACDGSPTLSWPIDHQCRNWPLVLLGLPGEKRGRGEAVAPPRGRPLGPPRD